MGKAEANADRGVREGEIGDDEMSSAVVAMDELQRIGDRIEVAVQRVEDFLDSPAGRRLRRLLAGTAIIGAPLLFRLPLLRRSPLLRALELAGGAALLVKFAEALRDWEPNARRGVVLEVPGTSR